MSTEHVQNTQEALVEALTDTISDALLSNDSELNEKFGFPVNIVDGLVYGMSRIANALRHLGLADAATPMGAIEALCVEMKESSERIANGLHDIAEAIRDHS